MKVTLFSLAVFYSSLEVTISHHIFAVVRE